MSNQGKRKYEHLHLNCCCLLLNFAVVFSISDVATAAGTSLGICISIMHCGHGQAHEGIGGGGLRRPRARARPRPSLNTQQVDKQNSCWESVSRYPWGNGDGDGDGYWGFRISNLGFGMGNWGPRLGLRCSIPESIDVGNAKFAYTDLDDFEMAPLPSRISIPVSSSGVGQKSGLL